MRAEKHMIVLKRMLSQPYITSKELEDILQVSNKTARKRLSLVSDEVAKHGASIEARPGKGYALRVTDEEAFRAYLNHIGGADGNHAEKRVERLIRLFIEYDGYIRVEDIAEMLYYSPKVVKKMVAESEIILESFNLKLKRKSHHGIAVSGSEYNLRRCLLAVVDKYDYLTIQKRLYEIVNIVFTDNSVKMSEAALSSFLLSLGISINRVKKGKALSKNDLYLQESDYLIKENLHIAKRCAGLIEKEFEIQFAEEEILYIASNIADKRYYDSEKDSIVIDKEINSLAVDILNNIMETYGLDFRKDLETYTMLVRHLIPLRLRLIQGNIIRNPIYQEINDKYKFALSIALGLNPIFERYFHKRISDDELSYIAMVVELAIEKHRLDTARKRNILLVCESGSGICAHFLKYQFEGHFKDCIGQSYACDYQDLKDYDFSHIDYVFSTVRIDMELPVPSYELEYYLDNKMIEDIKLIMSGPTVGIARYFSEKLFMTDVNAQNKEEIIHAMCKRIGEVKQIPTNFCDLVMRREQMLHTAMGNQVAIPHPCKIGDVKKLD